MPGSRPLRLSDLTDARSVEAALDEFDELGRQAFLEKYGFGESRSYFVVRKDRLYDSKPVLAAAWERQHGTRPSPSQFSGGDDATARRLRSLGFTVRSDSSAFEIDADSVDAAIAEATQVGVGNFLIRYELNPSARYEVAWDGQRIPAHALLAVAEHIKTGLPVRRVRNLGRREHIVEPLRELGFELLERGEPLEHAPAVTVEHAQGTLVLTDAPTPAETGANPRSRGFNGRLGIDFDENRARAVNLGLAGELAVIRFEQGRLRSAGRPDLAESVELVSVTQGDGTGYDVASFTLDGAQLFIEVKTTRGPQRRPFVMTANEVAFMESHSSSWRLYRVYEFNDELGSGSVFEITADILATYLREPTEYRIRL